MIRALASSAVDGGFGPRSCQTDDNKIGICCFSVMNAVISRKRKDWLGRNQNNVHDWSDMSTRVYCCFSELALLKYKADHIIILLKLTCSRHDIAEKKCRFGVKQQSLTHYIFNLTVERNGNLKINTIYLDKMVHMIQGIGKNTQYLLLSWNSF